jgi:hypothetical protein
VTGSTAPCRVAQPEPGHLVARLHTLRSGQGATLYATGGRWLAVAPRLPVAASVRAADSTSGVSPAVLLAAAVALVGGGAMSRVVRLAGRERVSSGGSADAAWAVPAASGASTPRGWRRWPPSSSPRRPS